MARRVRPPQSPPPRLPPPPPHTHHPPTHPGSAIAEQLGPRLTPEQLAATLQGTAALYSQQRRELDAQLQRFEAYALDICLRAPAGLLPPQQVRVRGWVDVCAPAGLLPPQQVHVRVLREGEEGAGGMRRGHVCVDEYAMSSDLHTRTPLGCACAVGVGGGGGGAAGGGGGGRGGGGCRAAVSSALLLLLLLRLLLLLLLHMHACRALTGECSQGGGASRRREACVCCRL